MYATTQEIYAAAKPLMPNGSGIHDINASWHQMAEADVNEAIMRQGIGVGAEDIGNMLKVAEICFYLDIAKNARQIEFVTGDVREEIIGQYKKQYSNNMPMFFFSQGSSRPFFQLLPTETFRMRGYKYITAYGAAYFKNKTGRNVVRPVVRVDRTSRGVGWMDNVVDY